MARVPCFKDGLACDGNETGNHVYPDTGDLITTDDEALPESCGDCDSNPRAEYDAFVTNGKTCTHTLCRDYPDMAGMTGDY